MTEISTKSSEQIRLIHTEYILWSGAQMEHQSQNFTNDDNKQCQLEPGKVLQRIYVPVLTQTPCTASARPL